MEPKKGSKSKKLRRKTNQNHDIITGKEYTSVEKYTREIKETEFQNHRNYYPDSR